MRTLDGRYRLEQRIGIGGMSEVWRAHDAVLDRPVAVKVMSPGQEGQDTSVERIRAEARSAARLVHPRRWPRTCGPARCWRIVVRVCAEVSAALAAAHAHVLASLGRPAGHLRFHAWGAG